MAKGPLEVTTDGGLHWTTPPTGPDHADSLAWAGGRLWSLVSCSVGAPCNELQTSDDSGSTWTTTSRFQPGVGTPAIAAASNTTAYIAWPAADGPDGRARQIAFTVDGGRSWTYEAAPCEAGPRLPSESVLAAGDDGTSLLLVCTDGVHNHGYFSTDRGQTWRSEAGLPNGTLNVAASLSSEAFFVGLGGSWTKGPLLGPYPGQWSYENLPQPVGAVRAIDPVIGIGTFFATESGVWFRSDNDRWERRAPCLRRRPRRRPRRASRDSVDPSRITTASFVDANVGFGLDTLDRPTDFVRTVDGGRTWTRVARFENGNGVSLYFVNADDGVAWSDNQLEVTSDSGADWTKPARRPARQGRDLGRGPSVGVGLLREVGHLPIAPGLHFRRRRPNLATDGTACSGTGRHLHHRDHPWRPRTLPGAIRRRGGPSSRSRMTADGRGTTGRRRAAGATRDLAYNGQTLLLICAQGPTASQEFEAFTSDDRGRTWSSPEKDPYVGGYFGALTNVGPAFVAAMQRGDIWASADGRTWRRESNVGEGFWSISTVPGVGAFAATGPADRNAGIVFSADGLHWEQRARFAADPPRNPDR